MPIQLDTPVQFLKGVGPRRALMLEKAEIRTAGDLLRYVPFRYEDRSQFFPIGSLTAEQEALVQGTVLVSGSYSTRRKRLRIFELLVGDQSGSIPVKFFNQAYLARLFQNGQRVILFGVPRRDSYSQGLIFVNPEFEIVSSDTSRQVHTGRIVPVYRRIEQLTTRVLRQVIHTLLEDLSDAPADLLPESICRRWGFPPLSDALESLHFPTQPGGSRERFLQQLNHFQTPGQQRFIFEEFFLFQMGLLLARNRREARSKDRAVTIDQKIRSRVKQILPFRPTRAQKRVLKEIVDDLRRPQAMNRLLQGDVGSGKTIVALQAMIVVVENGYQACLMVPTEILAEQHYRSILRILAGLGYRIDLLTGAVRGQERRSVLQSVEDGSTRILIGTHAVIQQGVSFAQLGMVVIDEQHRFGVLQRSVLMDKGENPDTLVMTATPIPRSLALTVYGDLKVSVLDELPPGRKPVRTVIKTERSRDEVYRAIRKELESGRQVYIVYPLIEESEKSDLKAATEMARSLSHNIFPDFEVGLLHGKLRPEKKERLMADFLSNRIDVLVSTTVIEVGIDVPNATVMLIEHSERFGLSQLHQLRGRIGRGGLSGLCILMTDRVASKEAYQRLDIMRRTNDGFVIAEKDLEIRGPGDFIGTRQSGVPKFSFGNILRDRKLLELARREAECYTETLAQSGDRDVERQISDIRALWRERFRLFEVG